MILRFDGSIPSTQRTLTAAVAAPDGVGAEAEGRAVAPGTEVMLVDVYLVRIASSLRLPMRTAPLEVIRRFSPIWTQRLVGT